MIRIYIIKACILYKLFRQHAYYLRREREREKRERERERKYAIYINTIRSCSKKRGRATKRV